MRALFLLLVAANLAWFAWSRYFSLPEASSDRQPLSRQLAPEKIRALSAKELDGLPAVPKPSAAAAPPPAVACLEWGGFAVAEAPRAEQGLAALALGDRLAQHRTEETAGWWVYMPSQGSRPAAQKKASELKALGVEEFFVLQDEGKFRWAVSLGVFSSEEAAKARLEALRARGVRSALIGPRETQVAKIWFRVREPDPALQAKLKELAQAHPGTELRPCP